MLIKFTSGGRGGGGPGHQARGHRVRGGSGLGGRWMRAAEREAQARGCRVVDGLGMLLHQAAPGFERWFGRRPEVDDETRRAVLE